MRVSSNRLLASGKYDIRIQTRHTKSSQAHEPAALPNVRLLAAPDSYTVESLTQAFESVELAFVNTDGFAVGEQAETYWSVRMFELATRAGVKHFVYSSLDAV